MTSNLGRKSVTDALSSVTDALSSVTDALSGVTDAPGLDPINVPRQVGVQQADGAERAELQRALLVYGMAGALGADQARGAIGDVRN